MPYNFVNGLKVRGMDIESLIPGIEGIPEAGSKYQFTGNGSIKSFTLPVSPYNKDAIDVYVKQLYIHPDDYTLVGDTVTLTEAPPAAVIGETYNVVIKVNLTTLTGNVDASRVSFEGENLDVILEKSKPLGNYSNLRAYAGAAAQVRITDPGVGGFFYYDSTDTTSADNGGTIIVDASGRRWKRLFNGDVNVLWFMSTAQFYDVKSGLASVDVTGSVQSAINCVALKGGAVYFPAGNYLLNGSIGLDGIRHGIHVPYTGAGISTSSESVVLYGDGNRSRLVAGNANMIIVRWSNNNSFMRDIMLQGNGTSTGLALISYNSTTATPSNAICYNNFIRITIGFCQESILLQCPLGLDNGVYYNNFSDCYIYYSNSPSGSQGGRGIYLHTAPGATGNQNRNSFRNISFQRMNTGIEIQDGDTNTFYSCTFEDVSKGSLPNTTPTAVLVNSGVISSASNRFFGFTAETCTLDVVNRNSYSEFYSCMLGILPGKAIFDNNPMVWLGGYDGSLQPTMFPGWSRNQGSGGITVTNRDIYNVGKLNAENVRFSTTTGIKIINAGSFGAINGNGNTKTLKITFDSALGVVNNAQIYVDTKMHGSYDSWNASGIKEIVTLISLAPNKTITAAADYDGLKSSTGIGVDGVLTRTGVTSSTVEATVTYTFNAPAGGNLKSYVHYDVQVSVVFTNPVDSRSFILSWV
jgi:hypothetical protein